MTRAHQPKPKSGTSKLRGWGKFFGFLIILAAAVCIGGFLKFASIIDQPIGERAIPKADGIVVWTGKGGGRLTAATQLLKDGYGERLLISGINQYNSREDIKGLLSIDDELGACCLDLDYAAINTAGNARETYIWAESLGYEHLILVTSAYHMPRARIEMSNAAGWIRITAYPVTSPDTGVWWRDRAQFGRYAREYGKLLRSLLREPRHHSTAGTPVAQDNGDLTPLQAPAKGSTPP